MTIPQISIIVAVYQAEKFLQRCLDSMITQTMTDWECILVDDGSTDNSGRLCDEYAANDSRFRVIHQANRGVAVARQTGLDAARGKYVIHADPDDWVDADYLKVFYDKAEEVQADMVFSDFIEIEPNERVYKSQRPSSLSCKDIIEDLFYNKLMGSCCNRLVKRTCFEQWNVRFHPAMTHMEDIYINCLLLINDIKVSYIPEAHYYYDQTTNEGSLTKRINQSYIDSARLFIDTLSPIVSDKQYDDAWYYRKKIAILVSFEVNGGPPYDVRQLYPEIHARLLQEMDNASFLSQRGGIRLYLKGHKRLGLFLFHFAAWFKKSVRHLTNNKLSLQ